MRTEDIEKMRTKAVSAAIEDSCVQITLTKNNLQWTVDYRHTHEWVKKLLKWGETFTMVDMRTGRQLYPVQEEGDDLFHPRTLREASMMLHEGKTIVVPDVVQL